MSTLLTLFLAAQLSEPDFSTREAAESALRSSGDWGTVTRLMRESVCPEARPRLARVRAALTIREVDALAGLYRVYPDARDLGWPCPYDEEAAALLVWFNCPEFTREPRTYEYDEDCRWYRYKWPPDSAQQQRTRAGLIAYVGRTGDWDTVRRTLK